MANVKVIIDTRALTIQLNDKSDPQNRGPREGSQRSQKVRTIIHEVDANEARWRLAKALEILEDGEITGYGTYAEDAIGGIFV